MSAPINERYQSANELLADLDAFTQAQLKAEEAENEEQEESFENPEIAALMNRHFVSIKVDREERPDLDDVYMAAVQAMTGSGGWPMSVFLTPDLRPFFGGTYFDFDAEAASFLDFSRASASAFAVSCLNEAIWSNAST